MIHGIIFDLDGVIADTQRYHSAIESELLKSLGILVKPLNITTRYAGMSDQEMFTDILKKNKKDTRYAKQLVNKKWEILMQLPKEKIKAVPFAIELITLLKNNRFALAVGSGAKKGFIQKVLQALQIVNLFDLVVSSDEVKYGKPNPDVFLLAAKKLNIVPENILVIEDGINGMIAAQRANMKCVGLVSKKDSSYPATLLITSLKQFQIKALATL